MAKVHPEIDPELKSWIEKQPVYFLASAPLEKDGHVNVSPRGLDSLRVTGKNEVIMLDMTGSGNESASHIHQNGRLTVMFCAFEGEPRILRLYGKARVIGESDPEWLQLRELFAMQSPGVRQIFHLKVTRVQTSCGFGVPLMNFVEQRDLLPDWAEKRGHEGLVEYRHRKNRQSIDGLPAPGLTEKSAE